MSKLRRLVGLGIVILFGRVYVTVQFSDTVKGAQRSTYYVSKSLLAETLVPFIRQPRACELAVS